MLYMVFDEKANVKLVKVGRAKNISERVGGYITHNPLAEMRWKSQGTASEEMYARSQLFNLGAKRVQPRSEWLIVSEELYQELYNKGFAMLKGFAKKNPRKI